MPSTARMRERVSFQKMSNSSSSISRFVAGAVGVVLSVLVGGKVCVLAVAALLTMSRLWRNHTCMEIMACWGRKEIGILCFPYHPGFIARH